MLTRQWELSGPAVVPPRLRRFPHASARRYAYGHEVHGADQQRIYSRSQSGSKWIIDHVFKRLLETERAAVEGENWKHAALDNQNYNFSSGDDGGADKRCPYALAVEPKVPTKFLYRGRVWVNAKDFAVCRIEAEPAKNPSIWIKRTDIRHAYLKVGDFWLPKEEYECFHYSPGWSRHADHRVPELRNPERAPSPGNRCGGSSASGCGWALVCAQSAKENPAADCNYKLSFQQDWRWYG
jgi:hypothetical protein